MTNPAREAAQARGADPALHLSLYMQLGGLLTDAEIALLIDAMAGPEGRDESSTKLQAAIDRAVALAVVRMTGGAPSPRRPRLAQKVCARP